MSITKSHALIKPPTVSTQSLTCTVPCNLGVTDPEWNSIFGQSQAAWGFAHRSVKNRVTLYIDRSNKQFLTGSWEYKVDFDVDYFDENDAISSSTTPKLIIGKSLTVKFDPASGAIEVDKDAFLFDDALDMQVRITNTTFTCPSGLVTKAQAEAMLFLEARITTDRKYDEPVPFAQGWLTVDPTLTDGHIRLTWADLKAEYYDIEWTWIDEQLPTTHEIRFTNNASRIRVSANETEYKIPMMYGKGWVFARIRPVYYCSVNDDALCEYVWSYEDVLPYTIQNIPAPGSVYPHFFKVDQEHEPDLNWTYSLSLAEEGKMKAVMNYADGSLKSRQSVTKINTDNTIIVGETVYDHAGRAAINVLPAPSEVSQIGHQVNFNRNDVDQPYTWRDFELQNGISQPSISEMSTSSGASRYYSPDNPDKSGFQAYLPDAHKYPFTVTQFENDGSGRVRAQSGLGYTHRIGGGHETRYGYSQPTQHLLNMLFGVDIGFVDNYVQQRTIDPNGQHSLSIMDKSGKVVATSLAGEVPSNMVDIGGGVTIPEIDFMVNNNVTFTNTDNVSSLTYDFAVEVSGTFDFTYKFQPELWEHDCEFITDICYDCVYEFEAKIYDKVTNELKKTVVDAFGAQDYFDPTHVNSCGRTITQENFTFPVTLDDGMYKVVKTLSVSEKAVAYYTDKYVEDIIENHNTLKDADPENETCFKTYEEFLEEELEAVDFDACNYSCEECEEEWALLPAGTEKDKLRDYCDELCNRSTDICGIKRRALLNDMKPGGQYAKFFSVEETTVNGKLEVEIVFDDFYRGASTKDDHRLSILNTNNFIPTILYEESPGTWKEISKIDWRHPFGGEYKDEFGATAYVPQGGKQVRPHELKSVKDFVRLFDDAWAEQLLPYHPEYPYLQYCELLSTNGTQAFDELMLNTNTYAEACALGLFNPLNLQGIDAVTYGVPSGVVTYNNVDFPNGDPFFYDQNFYGPMGGSDDFYRAKLLAKLKEYLSYKSSATYTIYQTVWAITTCNNAQNMADIEACAQNMNYPQCGTSGTALSGCTVAEQDRLWTFFRDMYLSAKQEVINRAQSEYAMRRATFNGYIGTNLYAGINSQYEKDEVMKIQERITNIGYVRTGPPDYYDILADPRQPCYEWNASRRNAFEDKAVRFASSVPAMLGLSASSMNDVDEMVKELLGDATGRVNNYCEDYCEGNADGWMASIAECMDDQDPNFQATYDLIRAEIVGLCTQGCDRDNPFGVVALPAGQTYVGTSGSFNSIQDIVDLHIGPGACDVSELRAARLGDFTGINGLPMLDDCGCDKLEANHQKFKDLQACNRLPVGITTEPQLFEYTYGVGIEGYDYFLCQCETYDDWELCEIEIPAPVVLTCAECFTCNHINKVAMLYEAELADDPTQTPPLLANESLNMDILNFDDRVGFAKLANEMLGQNLTANDYENYLACCSNVCDQPNDNAKDWFEFMQELAKGAPSYAGTALVDAANGAETVTQFTGQRLTQYNDINSGAAGCTFNIATSIKSAILGLNGYVPEGLHGYIHYTGVCNTATVLQGHYFVLSFVEERPYLGHATAYTQLFQNIEKFVTYKVLKGFGSNVLFLTAKMTDGSYRQVRLEVLELNGTSPNLGNNDNYKPFTDCIDADKQVQPQHIYVQESSTRPGTYWLNDNINVDFSIYRTAAMIMQEMSNVKRRCDVKIGSPNWIETTQEYFKDDLKVQTIPEFYNGKCDECTCKANEVMLCSQVSLEATRLGELMNKLGSGGRDLFTASSASFTIVPGTLAVTSSQINDAILPDNCAASTVDWETQSHDAVNSTLVAKLNFQGCDECYVYLYSDVPNVDFSEIVSISLLSAFPAGISDVDKNFQFTAYMSTATYCIDATTTATDQVQIYGYTDCFATTRCEGEQYFCNTDKKVFDGPDPCETRFNMVAQSNAKRRYDDYVEELKASFRMKYLKKCLVNNTEPYKTTEEFYADIPTTLQHFTLYYYDQAGSLIRTVPPEGVDFLDASNFAAVNAYRSNPTGYTVPGGVDIRPSHEYLTHYAYNSEGQPVWQETPDGGASEFWYDYLGRLVFSQNAKQKNAYTTAYKDYSYTRYDPQSRISEVGQLKVSNNYTFNAGYSINYGDDLTYYSNSAKSQVTKTWYDEEGPSSDVDAKFGGSQDNLVSRVSYTKYRVNGVPNNNDYDHATYYSYDIGGNVKALVQENPDLEPIDHDLKLIEYEYDLASGNVNQVAYQHGEPDRFYHRYAYDADNRITKVETSRDGELWTEDAVYDHYQHGSLARTELGDLKVQGLDYAYNINGWVKAVNGNILQPENDMGQDGLFTTPAASRGDIGRDVFGFVLGYFNGAASQEDDYTPISTSAIPFMAKADQYTSLYNGNIGYMSIAIGKLQSGVTDVDHYTYKYDQLNRLVTAQYSEDIWNSAGSNYDWVAGNLTDKYLTTLAYDGNGNIKTLDRNGDQSGINRLMDDLEYEYYTVNGKKTNRLKKVDEQVSDITYVNDYDPTLNDYEYDEIGNLVKDLDGEIDEIKWNVSGKVTEVIRTSAATKPGLEFRYDAAGNRIAKIVKATASPADWQATYYVRDAAGNVMATYHADILHDISYTSVLTLEEHQLYGSQRIGVSRQDFSLYEEDFVVSTTTWTDIWNYIDASGYSSTGINEPTVDHEAATLERGKHRYELANHLGNVLAVISDRKLGQDQTANQQIDYYEADVASAQDYYAFGSQMPNKTYTNLAFMDGYKYGFNGQEQDNEIYGAGNSTTALYWQYDARLGRRWNIDPKPNALFSPYSTFSNNPMFYTDVLGDTVYVFDDNGIFTGQIIADDGPHRGRMGDMEFEFGDQVNDHKNLINPNDYDEKTWETYLSRRESKSEDWWKVSIEEYDDVRKRMEDAGVFDKRTTFQGLRAINGNVGTKLDYGLGLERKEPPGEYKILSTEKGFMSFSNRNYGNFLIGASNPIISHGWVEDGVTKKLAHLYSFFKAPGWELDSEDDQLAISLGYQYYVKFFKETPESK